MCAAKSNLLTEIESAYLKTDLPEFSTGDTVKVHARIVEGSKERIQMYEGVVIKRNKGNSSSATFTVRKVSSNIGVERTFLLHSPRVEKIEVIGKGKVKRARLFYLRPLRGKAARIKSRYMAKKGLTAAVAKEEAAPEQDTTNPVVA